MCDQTPVDYKDGDVVWVKLGPCWWPGEVHDVNKLPADWLADFKKRPITAVKFFDENTYEYVKSIDRIYSYNCTKKNEFIKKGLDLQRTRNSISYMGKFRDDVITAEKRTNGNPDIVDDPMFSPEKKTNYAALLFGSSSKTKKSPRKSGGNPKRSSTIPKSQSPASSKALSSRSITHPRFLGQDDHEIRILVQSPDKPADETSEESMYNCTSCGFSTTRIDVIILHNKSHIQGVYSTPTSTVKKVKKPSPKKTKRLKMTKSKTSSIVEDLDLIEKGLFLSTESSDEDKSEEDEPEPRRKRKKAKRKLKRTVPAKKEEETKVDIRNNLLAEWEDDSETEEDNTLNMSCATTESDVSVNKGNELGLTDSTVEDSKKDIDKSCFDFEEEDEEIIGTSVGRKIPRVIPPADRLKAIDPGKDDADLPIAEDDVNRTEQTKELHDSVNKDATDEDSVIEVTNKDNGTSSEVSNITDEDLNKDVSNKNIAAAEQDADCSTNKDDIVNKSKEKVTNTEVLDVSEKKNEENDPFLEPDVDAFKEILDSTSVPHLPEMPHSLKYEQNFHNSKTIKFPDKLTTEPIEDKSSLSKLEAIIETQPKLINPKKRFVKSFEDFEQQLNSEQRKLIEIQPSPEKTSIPPISETVPLELTPEKVQPQPSPEKTIVKLSPEKTIVKPSPEKTIVKLSPEKTIVKPFPEKTIVKPSPEKTIVKPSPEKTIVKPSLEKIQSSPEKTEVQSPVKIQPEPSLVKIQTEPSPAIELRKSVEVEQSADKITTVVEVSKLKTQLMSKLENAEKLHPKEHSPKSKRLDVFRHSRSLRERILEKQREEKAEESWITKRSSDVHSTSISKPHLIESLSPKSKFLESVQPQSPHEAKTYEVTGEHKVGDKSEMQDEILQESQIIRKSPARRSSYKNESKPEIVLPEPKTTLCSEVHLPKPRRLSVKMPEIEESKPFDIEQTEELFSFEQNKAITLEPAKVLDVKETTDLLQVEEVVMEEACTKLQSPVRSRISEINDKDKLHPKTDSENEIPVEENLFNENSLDKNLDLQDSNLLNKASYAQYYEKNKSVPEVSSHDSQNEESHKTEEFHKTEKSQIAKHGMKLQVPKELDDYTDTQMTNDSSIAETNASIEEYVQSSMGISSANSENSISNFRIEGKDSEDLSALTTLATVSELTTNLDIHATNHNEKSKLLESNLADVTTSLDMHSGNNEKRSFTFVTEDDLADGQVEIAGTPTITKHKSPVTLTSFSVDFTDSNQSTNVQMPVASDTRSSSSETAAFSNIPSFSKKRKLSLSDADHSEVIHKTSSKILNQEKPTVTAVQNVKSLELTNIPKSNPSNSLTMGDSSNCDIEDQIPSLVVCSSMPEIKNANKTIYMEKTDSPEYTSSSKLLEILTDGKPKSLKTDVVVAQKSPTIFDLSVQSNRKSDPKFQTVISKEPAVASKTISKFDPKNSKFVIKSAIPGKSNVTPISNKSNKPIILSEKIIKPLTESSESVSVQKVTSKRSNQDIEDIDTFIIQKPAKKMMLCQDDAAERSPPPVASSQPVKKQSVPRGKAKILQQTIIKPGGDVIQPTVVSANATTTSQPPIDDNMFDINSMPIVLGDQILTAESIESMPVVLSDSPVQPTSTNVSTTTTTATTKPSTDHIKLLNKSTIPPSTQPVLVKTYSSSKVGKNPRVYQTGSTKIIKSSPAIITRPGKPDKFIIVPSGSSTATGTKYTVGKRPPVTKRASPIILPTLGSSTKTQNTASSEPTGNKIMIVTNQQGQQSRVLLTPAQQKMLGYQSTGSKLVKSTLKGNILQKASSAKTAVGSPVSSLTSSKMPSVLSHAVVNSKGEIIPTANQNLITSDGQVLMPVKTQQVRNLKGDPTKGGKKIQIHQQKVLLQEGLNAIKSSAIPGQQKTIVIKNQQGQIVKRFQGTDDAFLEQQVAEQVQAIKASGSFSAMRAKQEVVSSKFRPPLKRSYPKKSAVTDGIQRNKPQMVLNTGIGFTTTPKLQKAETSVPPLAPISPKKLDTSVLPQPVSKTEEVKVETPAVSKPEQQQKPLNQLIIQDALGNQTTITEGQILALPSGETIDGQPQSYMLVTLDESGNLAPLNNEALLSLDPNLCLGADLSNMVLHIDEGSTSAKRDSVDTAKSTEVSISSTDLQEVSRPQNNENLQKEIQLSSSADIPVSVQEHLLEEKPVSEPTGITDPNKTVTSAEAAEASHNVEAVQTVTCSIGNDLNQQLIITGDPISTQKFIESLTEGNPDLANLLASAEGNILIQTDEQQILINTDAENQVLLPMNAEGLGVIENSEGDGNPIFATQPSKNQDILAAALADTDVFQQEQTASPSQNKIPQSQLSPNSGLYPTGVSNVLETTLSLSSPIMTPLEVPSSNNKKIPDEETDILTTEVPKNVDLPITITDPNISQTVAQQQVASMIASELTSNLDLPLAIPDKGVPLSSAEMNSPSYVYSLPSLDESVDIHQKTFSGPISMPLLTEDPQESTSSEADILDVSSKNELSEKTVEEKEITTSAPCDVDIQSASSSSNMHLNSPSVDETSALFESSTLPIGDCMEDSEKLPSSSRSFLGTTIVGTEGLCTLGGAMCSSLSEPPPDMFDLSIVNRTFIPKIEMKQDHDADVKKSFESNVEMNEVFDTNIENRNFDPKTERKEEIKTERKEELKTDVPETPISEDTAIEEKPIDCSLEHVSTSEQNTVTEEYDKFEAYDTESRNDGTPSSNMPLNSESSSPAVNMDENSCEIPVQPQIVTDLSSSSFDTHETLDSADFDTNKKISSDDCIENEQKKSRFD